MRVCVHARVCAADLQVLILLSLTRSILGSIVSSCEVASGLNQAQTEVYVDGSGGSDGTNAVMRRCMEAVRLWCCSEVLEAQVLPHRLSEQDSN